MYPRLPQFLQAAGQRRYYPVEMDIRDEMGKYWDHTWSHQALLKWSDIRETTNWQLVLHRYVCVCIIMCICIYTHVIVTITIIIIIIAMFAIIIVFIIIIIIMIIIIFILKVFPLHIFIPSYIYSYNSYNRSNFIAVVSNNQFIPSMPRLSQDDDGLLLLGDQLRDLPGRRWHTLTEIPLGTVGCGENAWR